MSENNWYVGVLDFDIGGLVIYEEDTYKERVIDDGGYLHANMGRFSTPLTIPDLAIAVTQRIAQVERDTTFENVRLAYRIPRDPQPSTAYVIRTPTDICVYNPSTTRETVQHFMYDTCETVFGEIIGAVGDANAGGSACLIDLDMCVEVDQIDIPFGLTTSRHFHSA